MWQIAPGWFVFSFTNLQIKVCEFLRYPKRTLSSQLISEKDLFAYFVLSISQKKKS